MPPSTVRPPFPLSRPLDGPAFRACGSVDAYEKLNRIEEGSYGIVYRARHRGTGEVVALKRLKLGDSHTLANQGFPITSIREMHCLLSLCKHPHIVEVREVLVTPSHQSIFLAMEFVEHDLKSLMESMASPFLASESKTLLRQLLEATAFMHANWIMHRDLKTSNLLLNNRGHLKVADFGLARRWGEPQPDMTQLVVTLWYRAPELLLGARAYTTAIDMWSVGAVFAELLLKGPIFPGKGELDQISRIFKLLGTPNEDVWPGFSQLPAIQAATFVPQPRSRLVTKFPYLTAQGLDLLTRLLAYDPAQRITAQEALEHPYFRELPLPKDPALFPTFPSKGAGERRSYSPPAPAAVHGGAGRLRF